MATVLWEGIQRHDEKSAQRTDRNGSAHTRWRGVDQGINIAKTPIVNAAGKHGQGFL